MIGFAYDNNDEVPYRAYSSSSDGYLNEENGMTAADATSCFHVGAMTPDKRSILAISFWGHHCRYGFLGFAYPRTFTESWKVSCGGMSSGGSLMLAGIGGNT